ncbi:MAG: Na/Pi cotransporter family protein [Clostridiales bacterium]|nr:Na/Pi cotransporter family protein [Clostridiales bacterium]
MSFTNVLTLLGGLAMFLYGMNTMGEGLEKTAGSKMGQIIDKLTGNLFKGLLVGAGVTAIIQSSNATLVMVVGFINAGLMTLKQSVGVILGAHIGTTITSVIVSLNDIGDSMWILQLFKPSTLAPIALAAGIICLLFIKTNKSKNIGTILAGFGVLFIGMNSMSGAMEGLNDLPWFQSFMSSLSNPVIGIILGLVLTVVIQSSSASIGILQAAAFAGNIPFTAAAAIVLGNNVGSCVSALFSSIGANKESKRAALLNVFFMAGGMFIFSILLYVCRLGVFLPWWDSEATMVNISAFHILFNIFNSLLMTALSRPLLALVQKLVPDRPQDKEEKHKITSLDLRLIATPALAIMQTRRELVNMLIKAKDSLHTCYSILMGEEHKSEKELHAVETEIDRYDSAITQYLMRLTDQSLTEAESTAVSTMFHVVTDVERIGDHAYIIGKTLITMQEQGQEFSHVAREQVINMFKAVEKLVDMTIKAFETNDVRLASAVHPLEDVVGYLSDHLKSTHLKRLANKECHYQSGVYFLDLVNSLERISAYCSNVSLAVEQVGSKDSMDFDPHKHLKRVHENKSDKYTQVYDKYISKYTVG